jgi:hypothetical protein
MEDWAPVPLRFFLSFFFLFLSLSLSHRCNIITYSLFSVSHVVLARELHHLAYLAEAPVHGPAKGEVGRDEGGGRHDPLEGLGGVAQAEHGGLQVHACRIGKKEMRGVGREEREGGDLEGGRA